MPHLRLRSIDESAMLNLSRELPEALSQTLQTPLENFTIEKIATQFYKEGRPAEGDPMIEVLWFDRGQDIKNKCAEKITAIIKSHVSADFITVIFTSIPKENYYENGGHF